MKPQNSNSNTTNLTPSDTESELMRIELSKSVRIPLLSLFNDFVYKSYDQMEC